MTENAEGSELGWPVGAVVVDGVPLGEYDGASEGGREEDACFVTATSFVTLTSWSAVSL